MAESKEDVKYGADQAKLFEDQMLRVRYKHGSPLEGGKISESEPVDVFESTKRISQLSQQLGNNNEDDADHLSHLKSGQE